MLNIRFLANNLRPVAQPNCNAWFLRLKLTPPHPSIISLQGLDVGPESTKVIQTILKECGTILWNGPLGVFEWEPFAAGTMGVCHCLAEMTQSSGAVTIIGGGDSVAAVEKAGLADKMSHISTGGGASLELLEGKVLPGVAGLDAA
jgi:phosphoglycerate kinase